MTDSADKKPRPKRASKPRTPKPRSKPAAGSRRKPGRPKGSIKKPSPEDRAFMLSAIEAGASDHSAAKAFRVDPRTFKRWRAIAEGDEDHPEKAYLIDLFAEIDASKGRSRIRREIEVATRFPLPWLKNNAPSEPGLPGWTPRVPDDSDEEAVPIYAPSPEELAQTIRILIDSGSVPDLAREETDGEDDVQDAGTRTRLGESERAEDQPEELADP